MIHWKLRATHLQEVTKWGEGCSRPVFKTLSSWWLAMVSLPREAFSHPDVGWMGSLGWCWGCRALGVAGRERTGQRPPE